jgi:conjugative transposon TraM protein
MKITERINFRQPKYMLPAILYFPLLGASYFIFDLFNTEKAEVTDKTMQTTEYLNPELPGAKTKGDGIGGKYENMTKAWGKIGDYTAVDNIERDAPEEDKEQYESKYTENDIAMLDEQEKNKAKTEAADAQAREKEAMAELEKALAEARLKGQASVGGVGNDGNNEADGADRTDKILANGQVEVSGKITTDPNAVKKPSDDEKPSEVVKKVKTTSDYFNTLAQNEQEPKLIKAIIDENVKATDGSRVRLRLLDDVEINEHVVKRGSYLYATMSGFSSQRVKGNINSIMVDDELVKVNLSLYDMDGLEGLYVPSSQFRETSKDVASGAVSGNMNMNTSGTGSSFSQWGMQAVQNAYQKTSNAIGKAIKKNKVKLKYGTFVYIINSKENKK